MGKLNNENGQAWKWLCGILSAIILTGLTSWFTFGGNVATKEDVLKASHSIMTVVAKNTEAIEKLNDTLDEMEDSRHKDREILLVLQQRVAEIEKRVK